jgi:DNA-binding NarL/FixJ family response regulator
MDEPHGEYAEQDPGGLPRLPPCHPERNQPRKWHKSPENLEYQQTPAGLDDSHATKSLPGKHIPRVANSIIPRPAGLIRILLVNGEGLALEGLRRIVCGYPEFSVVATAHDRQSALKQIDLHRPHIVLMGIGSNPAGTDGIETTRIIRRRHMHTKVVILAPSQQAFYMREVFLAGAHGYLSNNIDQDELRTSLQVVYREGAVLQHDMTSHLLQMVSGRPSIGGDPLSDLSRRERQILFMLAHGHDTNQIATSLSLSSKTVRNYFSRIYAKLGTGNRLQTVLYARRSLMPCTGSPEAE